MRRNCKCKKCFVSNACQTFGNDVMEKVCDDVESISNCGKDCGCGFEEEESVFPINPMLGQSYVPWQVMDQTFKPCIGLKMGTIFPELVSPYVPCQSIEEINYIKCMNKIGEGCNKC